MVMSQAAGEAMAEGRLPFSRAAGRGMAMVDAPAAPAALIEAAFAVAHPLGSFSRFVCTEVA
ncbi:hypothetical protein [Ancylobacter sp.]|uniref:hypothetical protein n=1 Tax=Ancylobacter sp. TaxID=1872567 RepID=UPI003BAB260F